MKNLALLECKIYKWSLLTFFLTKSFFIKKNQTVNFISKRYRRKRYLKVLEEPDSKELDLIPNKEFRRRNMRFLRKHANTLVDIIKISEENKISWGTIIERNAQEYPDNVAIKFEDVTLTYKEFNEWVNRYANYFISLGLKKGDVVELMMANCPEYLMIVYGIGKIGAITSLINIDLRKMSLTHCLKLTPGKFIIVGENCYESFNSVQSDLDLSQGQILYFLPDQGLISIPEGFIDLSQEVKNFPGDNPSTTQNVKASDNFTYIFTSGTTGFPKATKVIHAGMVGTYYVFGHMIGEFTPTDTMYVSLPLFHSNSLAVGCASAFAGGAALAIGRRFSASRFWDEIRKHNATAFNYIGEVCRYLINQPPKPDDSDNPVRVAIGLGLRPEIWTEFKERFNIEKIGECYGATEGAGMFFNFLNFDRTVGLCVNPYAIVKYDHDTESPVRNEEGFMERVSLGESGLLLFQIVSEGKFRERILSVYTNKKASEAKIFHDIFEEGDVWFNTGDFMRDIGNNHAQFVDRLGDTFRWKGHNVSTTEVEKILNNFEPVLLSTVYGAQIQGTDGRAGMAAIVPSSSVEDFDLRGLIEHLNHNLPSYGVPIFLRFKSKLATTSTFKLKKVKLKKEGFSIENINEPLYVMLPGKSEYIPLTKEIYENIQNGQYKF